MKKLILLWLLVVTTGSMAAQSGTSVPSTVKTRFNKDYPGASASWNTEGTNYTATYKDPNTGMGRTVVYDKNGDFIRLESEMNKGYPAAISDYYSKNYPDEKYTIWSSTDDDGTPVYYSKRNGKMVWFDKNGNYSSTPPGKHK